MSDVEQVKVRLFGALSVELAGHPVHFRTKPAESILAGLCLAGDGTRNRIQIAAEIWPDEPFSVSGNRLRTSLVLLKQSLAPSDLVKGDRTVLWIDPSLLDSDLVAANTLIRKARVLQDLDQELETLLLLLRIIDRPLLEGFADEWIEPYRTTWIEHRTRNWLRVTQIYQESGHLLDAHAATEKALELDEFNSEAWVRHLRLSAQLNLGEQALNRYEQAKREYQGEFSQEVESVASRVSRGSIPPAKLHHEFTSAEKQLLIGTLEHMATHDPVGYQRVIGSQSFRFQVVRKPYAAFQMVLDSLEGPESDAEIKSGVIRAGLTASINLNEHQEVEGLCQWLIDHCPENTADHIIALQQLSFVRFEQRDWDSAYAFAGRALELARREQPAQVQFILVNIASFDWHRGKQDEAERAYLEGLDFYSDQQELRSRHNFAVISSNLGFLKTSARDWEAAHSYALDAWQRAAVDGFEPLRAMVGPLLGFTRTVLGAGDGIRPIIDGLTGSYRNRNIRFVEIGLDYAAGALACLSDGASALSILDAVTTLRGRRGHDRSIAEKKFADWVRERSGSLLGRQIQTSEVTHLAAVLSACSALEAHLAVI